MKFIFIILLFFCHVAGATNYYVKSGGSDAANGLTDGTAWETITKVNSFSFASGDSILFKRGDLFYGAIVVSRATIRFGAYGSGAKPIVSGFTTVTGWTDTGGNIWESSAVTGANVPNMVTIQNINTAMGRYPNTGWATLETATGLTAITDNELSGTPSFVGGECVIRDYSWFMSRAPITAHSAGTLTTGNHPYSGFEGTKFFIQNNVNTLDIQNEWFFSIANRKLKIYSAASPVAVKITTLDTLFYNGSYNDVTVSNINFEGANVAAICLGVSGANRSGLKVYNCGIYFSGRNAIYGTRIQSSTIEYCDISEANNNGILLNSVGGYSSFDTVRNCTISNVGLLVGMMYHTSGINDEMQAINVKGTNTTICRNRIDNVGYNGIQFRYGDNRVTYNRINNYCLSFADYGADGGGVYTVTSNGTGPYTGNVVDHNVIVNPFGVANNYYADDWSAGISFTYNTSVGGDNAMYLHNPKNITIDHNNFYNAKSNMFYIYNDDSLVNVTGLVNINNMFFATSTTCLMFNPFSKFRNDFTGWFTKSDTNKYWRPTLPSYKIGRYTYRPVAWPATLSGADFSLATLRSSYGYDLNSIEGAAEAKQASIFINYGASQTLTFDAKYKLINASIVNSAAVNEYESVIGVINSIDIQRRFKK